MEYEKRLPVNTFTGVEEFETGARRKERGQGCASYCVSICIRCGTAKEMRDEGETVKATLKRPSPRGRARGKRDESLFPGKPFVSERITIAV